MQTGAIAKLRSTAKRRALGHERVRRLLRPLVSIPRDKVYLFVVGCYNSGTTLLADILTHHPDISALPTEGAALTKALPWPEDLGCTRMWHLCEKEVAGTNASSDVADRMKRDWFLWWDRKKRVMLDKSVVNTARIQWLNRHFRPAYFVGIIRNGFAACEGIRRRASESHRLDRKRFPNGYSMELCARQWRRSIECLEEAASMVRDFYLLHYEDLVADTDQVVTRLVEWLPVGKEFALNEDYVFTFHRETNRIRDFNKAAIEKITEQDRAAVMQEAREKMEQYGYA